MAETQEPLTFRDLRVPEVRLVKLADKLTREETVETNLESITHDLISVEVTRHASGPGEYKLTLANWDPHTLRHKYNDFATLRFGTRLRIDMRYWPDPKVDIHDQDAKYKAWVPMIAGPITEIQFSFGGDGSRISITGEDDLRPLKDHSDKRLTYKDNEQNIIVRTLDAAQHYPLELAIPKLPQRLAFFTDHTALNRINEALEKGQSYLEYIQKFVEKYDLELYLSFVEMPPPDPPPQLPKPRPPSFRQVLNLVPSRASDGPTDRLIVLRHGYELVDFSPTIKVADQFTSVRIRGRNRHRDEPKGVDGFVDGEVVAEEVKHYVEPDKNDSPLVPAPAVRARFFGPNESNTKEQTNLDEYRAEAAARAQLLRKARELVVVQASTVGLPRLTPGRYVRIEGIKDPFDGIYYVSSTTHTCGSDGMKTRFTAQRAGMPLPDDKTGAHP